MNNMTDGAQASTYQERPTGDIVRQLSEQVSTLLREEMKLARLEMARKGKRAGIGEGECAAMTTSGHGRKAATEPPAEPEAMPQGTIPGDEEELRHEIEQTREQLGETVAQLVARADIKSRARAKAAEVTGRLRDSTAGVRAKAAERGAVWRRQVVNTTEAARRKAATLGGAAKAELHARAAPVWEAAPESVRCAAARGASTAKRHVVPLATAVVSLIAGYLTLQRWRNR
jgi:Protein of unknown function (DUF3618)/Putative Actinobacterial Holin-X, holin superfamily III